jgi:4-amino-4-deoxy-L-arabinose transferase-like glycosyltransferase
VNRFTRVLLLIALVALGVRVAYVTFAKGGECGVTVDGAVVASYPSECVVGDQIFYNAAANRLAEGRGFVEPLWAVSHPGEDPPPAADHPPLTVIALAPVSWLVEHAPLRGLVADDLGSHVREHRYTMAVLGTLLVVLIGLLGRRIGGDTTGLVAAAIAAVTPNLWVNDGLVMSETVTGLTVVGALLATLALRARPTWWRAALLGALCGLAALARAELVLFVPLLAIVACALAGSDWGARLRLAAVAGLGALVVVAPWVGHNLARFEEPTFLSTNDGLALSGSNCDPVYSGSGLGLTSFDAAAGCLDVPPPPGDQSGVAKVYRERAFEYMREHASRVPVVALARVGRTWSLFRPFDMVEYNTGEGRETWVTRFGLAIYYPTLALATAGAVVLWRRRERWQLWVLLVPALVVTLSSAVTYGQTRFRAAAEPSLAVLAAVAVVAAARAWFRSAPAAAPAPVREQAPPVAPAGA